MTMQVALLINERAVRAKLMADIGLPDVVFKEYSTASAALNDLSSKQFDLIIIDWKVYPGYGSSDMEIRELADAIPNSVHNENLLYWQTELRVINIIRDRDSQNRDTPIILRFPDIPLVHAFGMDDILTRETVQTDLQEKQGIGVLYGAGVPELANAVRQILLPE